MSPRINVWKQSVNVCMRACVRVLYDNSALIWQNDVNRVVEFYKY